MAETEMLKEPRIIVAKVAHVDQASGCVPAHVLQAKVKVREELVSAVKEKYEAYLARGSAAANFFRRAMLAQGAYQVESASERVRMGLDRARASASDGLRRWVRNRWSSAGSRRRKGPACGRSPGS